MSSSLAVFRLTGMKTYCFRRFGLRLADVLADLLVELRPRLPRPVLGELPHHALAGARNQQNLFARGRVQVHVDECLAIDLGQLIRGQRLRQQVGVGVHDGGEGPLLDECL